MAADAFNKRHNSAQTEIRQNLAPQAGQVLPQIVKPCNNGNIFSDLVPKLVKQRSGRKQPFELFPAFLQFVYDFDENFLRFQLCQIEEEIPDFGQHIQHTVRTRQQQPHQRVHHAADGILPQFERGQHAAHNPEDFVQPAVGVIHAAKPFLDPDCQLLKCLGLAEQVAAGDRAEHFAEGPAHGISESPEHVHQVLDAINQDLPPVSAVNGLRHHADGTRSAVHHSRAQHFPGVLPVVQDFIPLVGALVEYAADPVTDFRPHCRGFLSIAEDQLEALAPSAGHSVLQGPHHLGEGSDLTGCFQRLLPHIFQILDGGFIRDAELGLPGVGAHGRAAQRRQRGGNRVAGQPPLAQLFPEVLIIDLDPFLLVFDLVSLGILNVVVGRYAVLGDLLQIVLSRGHFQESVLQILRSHIGVFNTLPVDGRHLADTDRLGNVIHRHAGLLGSLSGQGCCVRHAHHGMGCILQLNAVIGELAQVAGHIRQAVDRLVRIGPQVVQILGHVLD